MVENISARQLKRENIGPDWRSSELCVCVCMCVYESVRPVAVVMLNKTPCISYYHCFPGILHSAEFIRMGAQSRISLGDFITVIKVTTLRPYAEKLHEKVGT